MTQDTKFVKVENNNYSVTDVCEGVVTIKDGQDISFWRIDGSCLFGSNWKNNNQAWHYWDDFENNKNNLPRFDSGVAVVRGKESGDCHTLLYLDGSTKTLDESWVKVTQFVDGIALAEQNINGNRKYFYINPIGEVAYPDLHINGGDSEAMRPLRNGLRAAPICLDEKGYNWAWGFIDESGKVVIPAKYKKAGNFNDGYCWVEKEGSSQKILIDTKGNELYKLGEYQQPSKVGDGIFTINESGWLKYYDITGKELARVKSGTGFVGGHAFIEDTSDTALSLQAVMVDTAFNVVKTLSNKVISTVEVADDRPKFGPIGLASIFNPNRGKQYVVDTNGDIVLCFKDNDYCHWRKLGVFQKSGYVKAGMTINDTQYTAFVRTDGEIAWIIGADEMPEVAQMPQNPYTEIIVKNIVDDTTKSPRDPKGPKTWTHSKYSVSLTVEGEGSATLSTAEGIEYGENVTLTIKPAKNWGLASIESDPQKNISSGVPFTVTSNMNVKVKFVEEEKIEAVPFTGCYECKIRNEVLTGSGYYTDFTVYAELNNGGDVESPYGANTNGMVTIMWDAEQRWECEFGSLYAFFRPMKVVGYQKDSTTGKEWLVCDGGDIMYKDLLITTGNLLMTAYVNAMIMADGISSGSMLPRRYRIELLDVDKSKGEFTFGKMQAYSVKNGRWVDAQSDELRIQTHKRCADIGLSGEYFSGVKMKMANKRNDIPWYPPKSWYKTESEFDRIIRALSDDYKKYKSDYELMFEN